MREGQASFEAFGSKCARPSAVVASPSCTMLEGAGRLMVIQNLRRTGCPILAALLFVANLDGRKRGSGRSEDRDHASAPALRGNHFGGVFADGTRVISGSLDKTLKLWDAATGRLIRTFEGHSRWVRSVVERLRLGSLFPS